jgi:hypothetical protein
MLTAPALCTACLKAMPQPHLRALKSEPPARAIFFRAEAKPNGGAHSADRYSRRPVLKYVPLGLTQQGLLMILAV